MTKKQAAMAFEAEMDSELDKIIEKKQKPYLDMLRSTEKNVEPTTSGLAACAQTKEDDANEESDTDSEAELATSVRTKKKRKHFTNDELLYDPNMDEEDAKWVAEKRNTVMMKRSILKNSPSARKKTDAHPMSTSDAVLNCPCCMTMLTMDCQRYSILLIKIIHLNEGFFNNLFFGFKTREI